MLSGHTSAQQATSLVVPNATISAYYLAEKVVKKSYLLSARSTQATTYFRIGKRLINPSTIQTPGHWPRRVHCELLSIIEYRKGCKMKQESLNLLSAAGLDQTALEWFGRFGTLQAGWLDCKRGDWMLILLRELSKPQALKDCEAEILTDTDFVKSQHDNIGNILKIRDALFLIVFHAYTSGIADKAAEPQTYSEYADLVRRYYPKIFD